MSGGTKIFRRDVTDTSATVSDLGVLGDIRQETDGNRYRLVKAGANIANGQLVQLDSVSGTGTSPWMVEGAHASTVPVFGACQARSVAAAAFLWVQCDGVITVASAYCGTDADLALNDVVELNSDVELEVHATTAADVDVIVCGQALATRTADATDTFVMYLSGMGV